MSPSRVHCVHTQRRLYTEGTATPPMLRTLHAVCNTTAKITNFLMPANKRFGNASPAYLTFAFYGDRTATSLAPEARGRASPCRVTGAADASLAANGNFGSNF